MQPRSDLERCVILLQGAPAAMLGLILWQQLSDTPEAATWLSAEEKRLLSALLVKSRSTASSSTAESSRAPSAHDAYDRTACASATRCRRRRCRWKGLGC